MKPTARAVGRLGEKAPAPKRGERSTPSSDFAFTRDSAAEWRDNKAHGVSRGWAGKTASAPEGRKTLTPEITFIHRYFVFA